MNGIYLYLLLKEIKNKLTGLHIDEIRSMHRMVQIICGDKALFVSLYPEAPAIFFSERIKKNFAKLKSFSDNIRSSRIKRIEQFDFMPVLRLGLERSDIDEKSKVEIIISLYRASLNFSIKTARSQKNLFPRYIEKRPKKSILELTERHLQSYHTEKGIDFKERLVKEIEGIDKYFANELTSENIKKLQAILSGEKVKPRLVSILPFRISLFASEYIKEYSSFNELLVEGIKKFTEKKEQDLLVFQKEELIRNLDRRIERLKKKLLKDEEIEEYRIAGEMILTNITKIKKGVHHINLFNPYIEKEVEIKLDPRKTPQENAQAYFSRYKKLKRGQPKVKHRIERFKKEIENIKAGIFEIPDTTSKSAGKKEKPPPFRTFNLISSSVVYVGKNARSNQELTFKFARPNDYFFHIRGYEGSHTILKAKVPKGQRPKKEDINIAASIAAHFSKAKNQKNVAVSYTQRKYLKKNKKGKLGSVILMREQVIFVDPGVPGE